MGSIFGCKSHELFIENGVMKVKLYPKLTDKVFGNKTYLDIFAGKHNIMPYGDMSQGLKWCDTRGNVEISDERFISGNFSAKFCGHESAQITGHCDVTTKTTYFIGVGACCTRFEKGIVGVSVYRNRKSLYAGISCTNDDFESAGMTFTADEGPFLWYAGSMSSGNADGYLDNFVLINMTECFGEEMPKDYEMRMMFDMYIHALQGECIVLDSFYKRNYISYEDRYAAFLSAMEQKANDLGLSKTHITSASGLNINTTSNCLEMNTILTVCSANNWISEVWGKKNRIIQVEGPNRRNVNIESTVKNELFEDSYVLLGGKTGTYEFLDGTLYNLSVVAADSKGRIFCGTVMKAKHRWSAMKRLFEIMGNIVDNPFLDTSEISIADTEAAIGWELPNYNCASFDISKAKVLFSQNSEESIFTASLIKLLSVLVAVDYIQDLNCEYVVQSRDVASGSGNVFKPGDVVKIKDLLYAALLPSSNTATNCIAQMVGNILAQGKDWEQHKML